MKYLAMAAGLAALMAAAIWHGMQPAAESQNLPDLPAVHAEQAALLQITAPGSRVRLHREKGEWFVDGEARVRANGEAVEKLLADLSAMRPVRLLTRNSERYAELGLGEDAVRLTLTDDSQAVLADIFIGKQGTDILSTYIRFADMDAVLAVDRTLVWQVRRSQEGWFAPEPVPEEEKELSI